MNKHVVIVIILTLVTGIGLASYKYALPFYQDWAQQQSSDARSNKGRIKIGIDNWAGYFPLCSAELRKRMRRADYLLECVDDAANYQQRMENLSSGELQLAVATVDSYLLNGAPFNYPGTIIAVIDESQGGDAILAYSEVISSINALKTQSNFKIAYTPSSPSEHLLKAVATHFDIEKLSQRTADWQIKTAGSSDALQLLMDRKVDAAVLWEPDVSEAKSNPLIKQLLSSADTSRLIVDVLIVNRRYAEKNEAAILNLLANYFRTLKFYRDNPQQLKRDLGSARNIDEQVIDSVIQGVAWTGLMANAKQWFGVVSQNAWEGQALIDVLEDTSTILVNHGDFTVSPIPDRDPYRLINSQFVGELFKTGNIVQSLVDSDKNTLRRVQFKSLNRKQWDGLSEVGTLKVRPIVFQSGANKLTTEGKVQLDLAVKNLSHYPRFRIAIKGHTGVRGDKEANSALSLARADSVKRYLNVTYDIQLERMQVYGKGGLTPLAKRPGESKRAYNYRLPRVEMVLVAEEY